MRLGTLAETGDPGILEFESEDTGKTFSIAIGDDLILTVTSQTIEIMARKRAVQSDINGIRRENQ
jgi:hypothetical protein